MIEVYIPTRGHKKTRPTNEGNLCVLKIEFIINFQILNMFFKEFPIQSLKMIHPYHRETTLGPQLRYYIFSKTIILKTWCLIPKITYIKIW